jgi:hypothetical protein
LISRKQFISLLAKWWRGGVTRRKKEIGGDEKVMPSNPAARAVK